MIKLNQTIKDLEIASKQGKFKYLITRYNPKQKNVDDLDVLVNEKDFEKVVGELEKLGYVASSHDHALGGRVKGAQVNLNKTNRIKIDLHKDFTWRAKRYIDLELVWSQKDLVDEFLVFINVIFEKAYIDREDYEYIWGKKNRVFENKEFEHQAKKYGWLATFIAFKSWKPNIKSLPVFLPLSLIFTSYLEKFHLISFLYFIFFRFRYLIWRILPYD